MIITFSSVQDKKRIKNDHKNLQNIGQKLPKISSYILLKNTPPGSDIPTPLCSTNC